MSTAPGSPTTTAPITAAPATTTTTQVEIPASTVVAIGLGFVALTSAALTSWIAFRWLRVYAQVRRRRRAGEHNLRVRDEWRRAGGMFGFMSGFANGAGDSALIVGAGGVEVRRRVELALWRERMKGERGEMVEPILWDSLIDVGSRHGDGEDDGDVVKKMDEWDILALATSPHPNLASSISAGPTHLSPLITVTVMIAMPTEAVSPNVAGSVEHEEGSGDLPDVMFGLTPMTPILKRDIGKDPCKNTGEVEHVEHADDPYEKGNVATSRRVRATDQGTWQEAMWKRDRQGEWYVEGLQNLH